MSYIISICKYSLIAIFCFLTSYLNAQQVLNGKVVDNQTKSNLMGVAVFIPELNKGTSTLQDGTYSITNLPKGNFHVQYSYLGYKTQIENVVLKDSINTVNLSLEPTLIESDEVVIYGMQNSAVNETATNITSLSMTTIKENGSLHISDAVSKIPGVSQLTTGAGISKPVIRGLYGNRIQTVLMGLRFDNQQWQDEHGLGVTDIGIDRVEVIKGPEALLYGSEAMGGVLNIIEEKPAEMGKTKYDLNQTFYSNTLGTASDFGIKKSTENRNWRIRIGAESHADYQDGNNYRVLNSRYQGFYLKTSLAYTHKTWSSVNNFMSSFNQFGFVADTITNIDDRKDFDARYSRTMDGPKHVVLFTILTSQNTFYRGKSKLKLNLGIHSNLRMENEGGNRISLNMLLNSYAANIMWETPVSPKILLSVGSQNIFQTNNNYGSRIIIPDADLFEASAYSYLKQNYHWVIIESGIRYDEKYIQTFEIAPVNNASNQIYPFAKWRGSLNGSLGASFVLGEHWNIKLNSCTGYRSPNLAELSSNGLHEGTMRYEIGDPNLKTEQNICTEADLSYEIKLLKINIAAYRNRFLNYIYLAPANTEYYGFKIYNYLQQNAILQGGEATIDFRVIEWLDITSSYAMLLAKADDGSNLPFIPANKVREEIKFETEHLKKLSHPFLKFGIDYVFAQNSPAQFETSTPTYYLLNAGLGADITIKKHLVSFIICGNNLLNQAYYDHLSRFKYYGIYNIGRNISFNMHIPLN